MKKIIPLLVVAILVTAFVPKIEAVVSKDLIFQIGESSKNLLMNGQNFSGSSSMFWGMSKRSCKFLCSNEDVIFITNITTTTNDIPVYGSALLLRVKKENRWKCIFFIGNESIAGMGGISTVVYVPDTINKIVVTYGNGSTTTHEL